MPSVPHYLGCLKVSEVELYSTLNEYPQKIRALLRPIRITHKVYCAAYCGRGTSMDMSTSPARDVFISDEFSRDRIGTRTQTHQAKN